MKKWLFTWLVLVCTHSWAQYYIKGIVKNEKGVPLEGAKINIFSKGEIPYYTDDSGLFGVPSSRMPDSIFIELAGYEPLRLQTKGNIFHVIQMKMIAREKAKQKNRLSSVIRNLRSQEILATSNILGESYFSLLENSFTETNHYPETGFSLTIDRAAYSNLRRFLNNGVKVPPDAVRIEELLNYFQFGNLPAKIGVNQFTFNSTVTTCPWNSKNYLTIINLQAPKLNVDTLVASNLVFLIDVSGSMDKDNRLPLIQSAFKLLVDNLREKDKVSIITYGGGVSVALPPTKGSDKKLIKQVIDSLSAGGDTPGEGAIRNAYQLARSSYMWGGNNRVVLATDGDFNVGQTTEKELEDLISAQRKTGIYLTCLGVGMGNYKDSKLETLAKKGDGNFAYIDNLQEAEKIFVTEFTKTMYTVANDTYVNVVFDTTAVKSYRLIGFDNKKDAIADTTSELEGGEVGSGHYLTAIFEIEPKDTTKKLNEKLAQVQLSFIPTLSHNAKRVNQQFSIVNNPIPFHEAPKEIQFASSVAMFGALLKQSKYAEHVQFSDILQIASNSVDITDPKQKEFLELVAKAEKIYNEVPKKKKPLQK